MNYASLIALLAAISFTLPFLVTLAENAGVPRGFSIVLTLAGALFALTWVWVRSRVLRRTALEERVAAIEHQRAETPERPEAFFLHGDHLGDLLLTLGRPSEALAVFEAYKRVAEQAGREVGSTERVIMSLRREGRQEETDEGV